MTDGPPVWGVPAYTGPDSPQSSVQLCPVCLHPVRSAAHYQAVAADEKLAAQMRERDADNASTGRPEH